MNETGLFFDIFLFFVIFCDCDMQTLLFLAVIDRLEDVVIFRPLFSFKPLLHKLSLGVREGAYEMKVEGGVIQARFFNGCSKVED